jgi:hypothetical protein
MNQVEEAKQVVLEGTTYNTSEGNHNGMLNHYIPYIQKLLPKQLRDKIEANTHMIVVKCTSLGTAVMDVHPHNNAYLIQYQVNTKEGIYSTNICSFKYYSMTNCCGALNFSSTNVDYPNRGIGSLLQYLKQDISYYAGVGYVQCCDRFIEKDNHILITHGGYKVVDSFMNPKSMNEVRVYGKHIDKFSEIKQFKIKIKD